jgi:hypothetical protein
MLSKKPAGGQHFLIFPFTIHLHGFMFQPTVRFTALEPADNI